MHLAAYLMELLCNGVCDSTANTAAYNSYLLETFCMSCSAERACKVMKTFALVHMIKLFGSCTNYLEDNGNSTLFSVKISYCKGDSLAVLICSENDELTGLRLFCNCGSFDIHKCYSGV